MNMNEDNSGTKESQQKNITITGPYGTLNIEDVLAAHDHATMRARELRAFLVLVSGEGQENFANLADDMQTSLHWMASRAAGELDDLLAQVKFVDARVSK